MYSSKWLDRGACPKCGSSDAKVKHAEGYSYCFSCETRFGEEEDMNNVTPMSAKATKDMITKSKRQILKSSFNSQDGFLHSFSFE